MRYMLLTTLFVLMVVPVWGQGNLPTPIIEGYQTNPAMPSLLLFVEGQTANLKAVRSGVYSTSETGIGANFTALLEVPASARSNILLKATLGHRQDDINAFTYLGRARLTNTVFGFGFGVRFLLK